MEEKLKMKMYVLVAKQLNPLQKGIQAAHAIVEYTIEHGDSENYRQWAEEDKTIVILDGGNMTELPVIKRTLEDWCIPHSTFEEEDLFGHTTAIAVLADERVWNLGRYPDVSEDLISQYEEFYSNWKERLVGSESNYELRQILMTRHTAK